MHTHRHRHTRISLAAHLVCGPKKQMVLWCIYAGQTFFFDLLQKKKKKKSLPGNF